MNEPEARYRLCGEVAGLVRAFVLQTGDNRVGSDGEGEIVLPVRGVSRRHAVVRVGVQGLTVDDLGSRNGTFIADAAVRRSRLSPGDQIRFGPVSLRLERIDARDADLAIEFAGAAEPQLSGALSGATEVLDKEAPVTPDHAHGLAFPAGYVRGESPAVAALYDQMKPLVQGDLPVLLLGETGVGKECVARILHLSSPRRGGPFVAVNCAAIPADLLEAEMFGIGKGVATGVVERSGKFQLAQGGTLLLDEIGEMPSSLQAKLLRALQEKEVQPVGGSPVSVDIRVVAATNSDLQRHIDDGSFRRDLYYRVAGYALRVPPLRERCEDVRSLVEAFIRQFAGESGKTVRGITVRALQALRDYAWPGNVRELEHEIRRLVYLCPDGQAIDSGMLSAHVTGAASIGGAGEADSGDTPPGVDVVHSSLESQVERLERRLIREALARSGGNRSEAARQLGISRNGLALKMDRLGITD